MAVSVKASAMHSPHKAIMLLGYCVKTGTSGVGIAVEPAVGRQVDPRSSGAHCCVAERVGRNCPWE